jgi:hypothetical protein
MRKIFATCLALFGFLFLTAQSAEIPSSVKMAFKNQYKSTTVVWTASAQSYIAKWETNNKHMTAYYTKDEQPVLVRTETDVALVELSSGTQTNVNDRFLGQGSAYTLIRSFNVEGFGTSTEGCEFSTGNGNKISVFFDETGNMTRREIN